VAPEGRVAGTATLSRGGRVEAALRVEDARVDHALLAATPLPFTGRVELRGAWDAAARAGSGAVRVALERVVLEAELDVALDEAGELRRARLEATLPETPCADVLAALPRPLAAPLLGMDLAGDLGGRLALGFDLARPEDARLDLALDMGCRVVRDDGPAQVARLGGAYEHALPDGRTRFLDGRDPDFVALDDLPRHVWGAFVAAEDARFFQHDGFDLDQLRRSFGIDVAARRVERGGSTISQQLVKNLYLTRERTLGRKLVEAVLTWHLEQRVDKRRILEAYLNVIELGDGVYGLGPASRRWFGKDAARLSPAEAAFLAAITPAPRTAERTLGHAGRLDDAFYRRGEIVLHAMRRGALVSRADLPSHLHALEKLRLKTL
jgi:penicillin-binding protein 1A